MNSMRGRTRQRGLETVEMAILLPVFLLLMLGTLDLCRMFFTEITLQHAMREGGRFGVTGRQLPDPAHPATLQSRLDSIRQIVRAAAVGVRVNADDIVITSASGGKGSAGGPGDTLTISMNYRFVFVTPLVGKYFDGAYAFTVSTSFRNEPFPAGTPS